MHFKDLLDVAKDVTMHFLIGDVLLGGLEHLFNDFL